MGAREPKRRAQRASPPAEPGHHLTEDLVPLPAATTLLPRRRGGRPVHPSTLYRWARTGLRLGDAVVRLEVVPVGGTLCVSVQALERFFEALKAARIDANATTAGGGR